MARKKQSKKIKVRDLKPRKDAKGGIGSQGLSGGRPHGPQTPVGPPNRGG